MTQKAPIIIEYFYRIDTLFRTKLINHNTNRQHTGYKVEKKFICFISLDMALISSNGPFLKKCKNFIPIVLITGFETPCFL